MAKSISIEIIKDYLQAGEEVFNHPLIKTFLTNRMETRTTKSESRYGWSPEAKKRCIRCALSKFSGLNKFGECTGVFGPIEREFVCDNLQLRTKKPEVTPVN